MASKKNYYYIENIGCDDETVGLFYMDESEFESFKSIIENLNKNSTYGCMPTIEVYKIDESFIRPATDEDSDDKIMFTDKGKYVLSKSIYNYYNLAFRDESTLVEGAEQVI